MKIQGIKSVYIILIFLILSKNIKSQSSSDGQLWLNAEFNYVYKVKHLFQDEVSFQSLVFGSPQWYSFSNKLQYEYNINPHFDAITALPLSYTIQSKSLKTFEIRYMIGTRIYFTPTRRLQTKGLIRWENRWSNDNNSDSWDVGNRLRIRGEVVYPLNKNTYYTNNVWYLMGDAEVFLTTKDDIQERFANKTRFRLGAGYRLTYRLRFEAFYACQFSRNTIDNKFDSQNNILEFLFKYYFR